MLALICGAGDLPSAIVEAVSERPLVCALEGFEPDNLTADVAFRLETLGTLMADLKARGVTRVCFCGHIRRPTLDPSRIDAATMPLVPRFMAALKLGDDGALRVALALFAEAGFDLLAAHEAAPALLPTAGVPTKAQPSASVAAEAKLGDEVLAEMGASDQGQACVIRATEVLARERDDGTDAMLRRLSEDGGPVGLVTTIADNTGALLGAAADWLSGLDGKGDGILFKAPKPQQDRRIDLPVIGPETVHGVAHARLAGLVIEAQGVMVLHRERVVAMCDEAGLFLWIRERQG